MHDGFEHLGEDRIRSKVDDGTLSEIQMPHAKDWLAGLERDRLAAKKIEDGKAEVLELNRRAVVASETQAIYAKRAYIRSNVAISISIVAVIVGGFFSLLAFLKP